jgi:oligogalacturonide lyase
MNLLNTIRRITTETSEIAWKARVASATPLLALSFLLVSSVNAFGQANSPAATPQTQTPPKTWIDPDTGHRITHLTDEPNSEALPSGRNAFTPDGLDMIYVSPHGIHVLNLATLKTKLLVSSDRVRNVIVGTKTRRVFFTSLGAYVRVVDIDTGQQSIVSHSLFPSLCVFFSVNADETLLVGTSIGSHFGTSIDPSAVQKDFLHFKIKALEEADEHFKANHANSLSSDEVEQNAKRMRLEAQIPEEMFTYNLQTGEVRTILKGTDWLNKVQFSPTDPNLILYAHDGPDASTEIDRIWTIRADGTQNQMIHQRAISGEIATHEFWSQDGKTIWYELQRPIANQPASTDHYLVGYDVATGKRRYFQMDELEYSINYDAANNDSLFCGSGQQFKPTHGSGPIDSQLPRNGEWIEILHPILNNGDIGASMHDANSFRRERLVNIFNNRKYTTSRWFASEVRFSPDGRLVIFTSKVFGDPYGFGPTYVYAVEVN